MNLQNISGIVPDLHSVAHTQLFRSQTPDVPGAEEARNDLVVPLQVYQTALDQATVTNHVSVEGDKT